MVEIGLRIETIIDWDLMRQGGWRIFIWKNIVILLK